MPIVILFFAVPLVSLFIALAFYSQRPPVQGAAWFALLFFTAWFTYSLRGVGLAVPFVSLAALAWLLRSADPSLRGRALWRRVWGCLKF